MKLIFFTALAATSLAQAEELLRYNVNWPSGLSLGEATLRSNAVIAGKDTPARQEMEMTIDASIPGFAVADKFRSVASNDFCSMEFEKQISHGSRKTREVVEFKPSEGTATRRTEPGGGKSDIRITGCTHDALSYLFFLRKELAGGRLPPSQHVIFGAAYRVSTAFGGTQQMVVGESRVDTDRIVTTFKGPASETTFEMFFARDAVRTPVMIKVPLALGSFSLELTQ